MNWNLNNPHRAKQRTSLTLLGAMVILAVMVALSLLSIFLTSSAKAAEQIDPVIPPLCQTVTSIPLTECAALISLYDATAGAQWLRHDGWLTANAGMSPCQWYGVVCAAGHVTELNLHSNRLNGQIPASLRGFDQIRQLQLADNLLEGPIPAEICDLVDTVELASFDFNKLGSNSFAVRRCMNQFDPDWFLTQTVPPVVLRVSNITTSSIALSWIPISYTTASGYYEVSYSTTFGASTFNLTKTVALSDSTYTIDGLLPGQTYFIRLRTKTLALGGQSNEQVSGELLQVAVTLADSNPVVMAVYFPADNDLSPYIPLVLERLRRGSLLNHTLRVFYLADGSAADDTKLYLIEKGMVTESSAIVDKWGITELNTSDPSILAWFLTYVRSQGGASRTIVSLMGHGAGLTPEVANPLIDSARAQPPLANLYPILPQRIDSTPSDITNNGDYLSTQDYAQALATATNNGADPFDLIFFDQCFQGNLDVLYEVRTYAEVFIASPNYAWLSAPYDRYLPMLTPSATPEEMAAAMITIYQRSLSQEHPNSIVWARSADIASIANAANGLSLALIKALNGGDGFKVARAARESKYVDTTMCGSGNLQLAPPDELVGAGSFARNLQIAFPVGDVAGVNAAASNLLAELIKVRRSARVGRPYIAPDEYWDYDDGLTILAPLARDTPSGVAWRASIYTSTTPLQAIWGSDPSQTVIVASSFASVREGTWDEFINRWYIGPAKPTVGEGCNYTPPVLISGDVTETLALTVEVVGEEVGAWGSEALASAAQRDLLLNLSWSATGDSTANGYWVLVKRADSTRSVVLANVPLTQTNLTVSAPPTTHDATYHFAVVAQTLEGITVAASNTAIWKVEPGGLPQQSVYLPFVTR